MSPTSIDLPARYLASVEPAVLARWSRDALAPFGFSPENTLPMVGVCRDELMFATEQHLHDAWGPAFDLSGLAGMVFIGRTGMSAAAHHAPGADGRTRYVGFVITHIGLADDGTAGGVRRPGIDEESTACGALLALARGLGHGDAPAGIDLDDAEMSLLRLALDEHLPRGTVPDLWALTELTRRVATDEVVRLAHELLESPRSDVAVVSATVIHGPAGDRVAVGDAWVRIGSGAVQPLDPPRA
jgi:hypothetical protein